MHFRHSAFFNTPGLRTPALRIQTQTDEYKSTLTNLTLFFRVTGNILSIGVRALLLLIGLQMKGFLLKIDKRDIQGNMSSLAISIKS